MSHTLQFQECLLPLPVLTSWSPMSDSHEWLDTVPPGTQHFIYISLPCSHLEEKNHSLLDVETHPDSQLGTRLSWKLSWKKSGHCISACNFIEIEICCKLDEAWSQAVKVQSTLILLKESECLKHIAFHYGYWSCCCFGFFAGIKSQEKARLKYKTSSVLFLSVSL